MWIYFFVFYPFLLLFFLFIIRSSHYSGLSFEQIFSFAIFEIKEENIYENSGKKSSFNIYNQTLMVDE